jgi:hypothetical protein
MMAPMVKKTPSAKSMYPVIFAAVLDFEPFIVLIVLRLLSHHAQVPAIDTTP